MGFSRRSFLAGAAAPILGCAGDGDASSRLPALHITPDGAGDGSSWENAADLRLIEDLVFNIRPGGEILIAAERGEYRIDRALEIAAGGRPNAVVRVRGVNSVSGEASPAVIRGVRSPTEVGVDAFRLLRGADHLHFSHFDFRATGNGCFRVGGPVSGLTIEDCAFEDIYRFLENTSSNDEPSASLRSFAVRRCQGQGVQRGFSRLRYSSRDGVFEDCRAQGMANEGGDIPAGCALDDRASAITYRRCVMENFQQWRSGDYWNGDGFSDEGGNRNIRYEQCEARGSTDGGFDCKSIAVVLEDCIAEDNKRNFRVWDERATLTRCISRNPNFRGRDVEQADACHIWIGAGRGPIQIDDLTIEDQGSTPILEFEHDSARVEIRGVRVDAPRENWGEDSDRVQANMILAR